ncbi:MAG: hypothetical protein ABFC38_13085 [Methanospirillum sp.]
MKAPPESGESSGDNHGGVRAELDPLPDIPPEIIEAVNQNRLAVFIGAGASRIMGYPDWPTLAEMVIDACRKYVEQNSLDASVPLNYGKNALV